MRLLARTNWLVSMVAAVSLGLTLNVAYASSADDYVASAREHLEKGEAKAAIIELKNALQSDPSHVNARLLLGTLHLRGADGAAAAKEFGRARDLGAATERWMPGYARAMTLQGEFRKLLDEVQVDDTIAGKVRAEILALRGNAHLALGSIEDADAEYDSALKIDSENPMASLGKAQLLLIERRDDDAMDHLNRVLAAHPGHVESRLVRGDLFRRLQRLDDAETDYARAAEEAPNNPRAHIGLALVHVAKRDVAAAKKDLETLNRVAKNLPAVNYLQALVSFQEQDYERASDELQALLRVAPGNLQAQLLYGIVSYARNEFTIADDYLTRVLASTPGNPQVIKLLGAARLKLRQPDRAVDIMAPVVNEQTEDAQLLALLGTAYIQSGDNTKGAEYIERAVKIDPEQALLRTQLAVGQIAAGDTAAAITQLESAVALGQDVVQADVLLVLSYLNKREYDKAIAASEALEKRMPDSPIPFNLTGLAYLAQKQFDQAQARFDQALDKDPKFLVAQMNLARLALVARKPEDAKASFDKVLQLDPKHIGAMLGRASLATAEGDPDAAEEWLLRANRANPKALRPILVLAEGYLRKNEGLKAVNMLSGLTPEQAQLPATLRLKGMAQLQSGDYASATRTLSSLTEKSPDSIEAWFQLGRAQAAAGDANRSRESFNRAIALDTKHKVPVVWVGLGELELREKQYEAALEVSERIKEHFPNSVYGFDIASAAHRGLNDIDRSLQAANAALQVQPTAKRVDAYARALAGAGKLDDAVKLLRAWLKKNPDDGGRWAKLGLIQQQLGNGDEALRAYEKSVETAEPGAVLANNMAWLYLERNDKRAVELATKAYELAPSRAEIVDTYGWVLFRNGRKSDGLAALQQALIIAPRNPEIALHVAEALHDLERDGEAKPMLERIVREHPNSSFSESAKDLLSRLRG